MVKTVVSITCLGTRHHRDKHRSALVGVYEDIHTYAQGEDSTVAAWLIDGVGCQGSPEHPTPGTYIYESGKKRVVSATVVSQWVYHFHKFMRQMRGALSGEGVESSLLEATLYVEEIIKQNRGVLPEAINLQGFSRGADTCVRLANILNRLHPEIPVNLCLLDPVPGPDRRKDPDSYIIPPNVRHCDISLMLNEHKQPFQPQHRGRYVFKNTQTRVSMRFLPGMHGACIASVANEKKTPLVAQLLTQDVLLKFNIQHGSLPSDAVLKYRHTKPSIYTGGIQASPLASLQGPLTPKVRFGYLSEAMDSFVRLAQRNEVKVYSLRAIFRHRNDELLNHTLFIDQEHRSLFHALFPATFNWLFEKNIGGYAYAQVVEELAALKAEFPGFHQALMQAFPADTLQDPQGVARQETMTWDQPLVFDELSYLTYSLGSISDYYHYHSPSADRDRYSTIQADKIKNVLRRSRLLPDAEAKTMLVALIRSISQDNGQGFIAREVARIIPDSEQYISAVLTELRGKQHTLFDEPAGLVEETMQLIQQVQAMPQKDAYHKRIEVQQYLIDLNATLIDGQRAWGAEELAVSNLSLRLTRLSHPSYAESNYLDKIIRDLNGYLYWRSFLACFPKCFGWYHPERIELATSVLEELRHIKNSPSAQYDVVKVKEILEKASLGHYQPYQNMSERQWKQQLGFKKDALNTIFLTHLDKITALPHFFSYDSPAARLSHRS